MKVGSLEESVTVSGASPVVDVTSTVTATRLTRETLELIPSTRNGVLSLMQQAPGLRGNLDLGGSNFSAIPSFAAYGQSNEQWSTLEGVLTQDPIGGTASGNYWDYSSFEETQVERDREGRGNPRARRAARRDREIGRQRFSRQRLFQRYEPQIPERQHRRSPAIAGHHESEHAREAVGRERRSRRAHRPRQALVLHVDSPSRAR